MTAMKNYINHSKLFLIHIFFLQGLLISAQQSPVPPKRAHHALIYDDSKKQVMLFGGSTPIDGGNSAIFLNDIWTYDGKWTNGGEAGDKRSGVGLAFDSKRKKIFSLGGFTGEARSELRVWENNDPMAIGWKKISDLPGSTAAEAGFVYDSQRDRLITFGGSPGQRKVNSDTWEWDGNQWKKFEGTNPEGRQAFVMIFDEARKKTVLFGGLGATPGTILDDTWEFDGKGWQKMPVTGPARASAGYAYDSDKQMLIVFGGMTKNGFVNDTWSYDGKEWKQLSTEGPPKRAMGYLAYDKQRKKVLLFGGRLGWPNDANDTWEWDGTKWTEIKF
jgi:N-acetylneuraminic acid mutarotase